MTASAATAARSCAQHSLDVTRRAARVSLSHLCLWEGPLQPLRAQRPHRVPPPSPGRKARTAAGSLLSRLGIVTHGGGPSSRAAAVPRQGAMRREVCGAYSHPRQTRPSKGCTACAVSCKRLVADAASSHVHAKRFSHSVCHHNAIMHRLRAELVRRLSHRNISGEFSGLMLDREV